MASDGHHALHASEAHRHFSSNLQQPSMRERSASGAVELALIPAVDIATLISGNTGDADATDTENAKAEEVVESAAAAHALSTEYLQYLEALKSSWKDCPAIEIAYQGLEYQIRNEATIADAGQAAAREKRGKIGGIPSASEENTPNLAKALLHMALGPVRMAQAAYRATTGVEVDPEEILHALAPTSGVIKPNTMTLVLAPPGAGKSTLLRALVGRLNGDAGLKGEVRYNGLSTAECAARGIHVTRLCSYVGQNDIAFPVLSVEETLEFARQNGVADVELLNPDQKLRAMDTKRTELLMEMLGLMECRTTAIGSDLMRGVSGGQKKRSQIGEALMSNSRVLALDEVSNGLDSAVTLHIFSTLKAACAINRSSIVTALQQVTPETYALFDQVILMREGHVLYNGPRTGIRGWLKEVMAVPFIPDSLEEAGFLVDLLSDPKQALEKAALAYKVSLQQTEAAAGAAAAAGGISQQPTTIVVTAPAASESKMAEDPSPASSANGNGVVLNPSTPALVHFHIDSDDASEVVAHPKALVMGLALEAQPPALAGRLTSRDPSPFKLAPEVLEKIADIDLLLATNARSSYAALAKARLEETLAAGATASKSMDVASWSPYSRSQYGQAFPHSTLRHTALCSQRQVKLIGRNLTMVVPRVFNSVLMGLVYGTLFFQLKDQDFASKLGIIQNAVMFMAFANFQELPVAAEGKQVVVRQINAGFYPAFAYTTAVNLLTIPLACIESVIFGILVYFIPGFANDAGRFFFFLFLLLSISSAMSQTFRTITYIASNADVAHQMNLPFVMLFVVYGGFLIPRAQIQNWLIWAYYLSPFSWGTDSLAVNEFSASKYDARDSVTGVRAGDSYLDSFGLRSGQEWQWAAIAYLWGFYFVLSVASSLLLIFSTPTQPMGTKRAVRAKSKKQIAELMERQNNPNANGSVRIEIEGVGATNGHSNGTSNGAATGVDSLGVPQAKRLGGAKSSAKASFQLSSLPFTPATLSWKDLKYTVYIGKEKTPRVLLNHISGFAEPGKLTALMGASGAGKTTLMDVIAGRKTVGLIESDANIFVNGRSKDPKTFASITGYVEQTDIHNGMATVKEALDFSAKLRLPASVDDTTREHFVHEVMGLVGLTNIQNRMIGDASQPSLSTGQLKLLTIAVELVANPSIIFLDEPTSGLDSKSAYRVMRAIKRIAATNRTIVCTIHQPSQEVFFMFDKLLLLRRGGETVYFDDIGPQGEQLVGYLSRVSRNLLPYSPLLSPANWMLDIVGLDASQLVEEQKVAEAEAAVEKSKAEAEAQAKAKSSGGVVLVAEQKAPSEVVAVAAASGSSDQTLHQAFKRKLLQAAKSSARNGGGSMMLSEAEADNAEPIQFADEWRKSKECIAVQEAVERYSSSNGTAAASEAEVQYANDFTRLAWVVRRAYLSHWRSPPVNITRCILMFIIGLFLGIVYYDTSVEDFAGMSTLLAAVFLGVSLPSSICSNASLSTFFRQRAVYYRESSVKMYGYKIYTFTMTLVELPYLLIGLLCFLIPFYFMVGLSTDAGLFFQFLLASYLMVLFFSFVEQVFIASLPNIVAAQALNGLVMSIMFAFGGLYIKASAIPIGWKWFYYIDPIPKSFIATMLTQVHCPNYSPNLAPGFGGRIEGCRPINVPGVGDVQLYDYIAKLLEGSHDSYWPMIGYLFLTLGVIRIFSVYLFKKVSHIER